MSSSLSTLAERSRFQHTGRLDEVERLAAAFVARWPQTVRSLEYGRSTEGRPLRALVVSNAGSLDAAQLRKRGVPVVMFQAGIHPGESDGKDAGFIALRELLESDSPLLDNLAILFVPAFNADGHERVGRWNRPNQNGPLETGWRTTAQNLNLNRDYTKADAPEMRAMLRLINTWDPLICADLHVTDGADFEPDISLQAEPINQGDVQLRASGVQLRDELIAKLAAQGSLPLSFYPDLARTDDPSSGFILTVYSPRFSTGYFPQRNRFTVLVETHSWKPYAARVEVMRKTLIGLVELTATHGPRWLNLAHRADATAAALGGHELTLDFASGWREPSKAGKAAADTDDASASIIEFRGYAYTREPSPISGDLVTTYDPSTPQIWRVPYRSQVKPSLTLSAPRGGYVIPPAYAEELGERLALHGIETLKLETEKLAERVQCFRAESVSFSPAPFEGRMRATLQGKWRAESRNVSAHSLFVPIARPLARLVVALLEPCAPDSFAAWGFFNACFEQKEQIEPYVAEIIAKEMMQNDPALAELFERRLASDASFASDPAARLEFFLRRHASWDEQLNLYPILRIN